MSDQEDTLQINTSNQFEEDRKLAKKKKIIADKKLDKHKKSPKPQSGDGTVSKKLKVKRLEKKVINNHIFNLGKFSLFIFLLIKNLEKNLKKVKPTLLNDTKADEKNETEIAIKVKRPKKFDKNSHSNSQPSSGPTSKMAKFSSLFKNNHEIPRVGE